MSGTRPSDAEIRQVSGALRAWVEQRCRDLDPESREDVIQDAWAGTLLHLNRHGVENRGSLVALAITVARNRAEDLRRSAARRTVPADPHGPLIHAVADERPDSATEVETADSRELVERLLRELPIDERRLLRLVYCQDHRPALARSRMRLKRKRYELLHARALRRILPHLVGSPAFEVARDRLISELDRGTASSMRLLAARKVANADPAVNEVLARLGNTAHAIGLAVPAEQAARALDVATVPQRITALAEKLGPSGSKAAEAEAGGLASAGLLAKLALGGAATKTASCFSAAALVACLVSVDPLSRGGDAEEARASGPRSASADRRPPQPMLVDAASLAHAQQHGGDDSTERIEPPSIESIPYKGTFVGPAGSSASDESAAASPVPPSVAQTHAPPATSGDTGLEGDLLPSPAPVPVPGQGVPVSPPGPPPPPVDQVEDAPATPVDDGGS